MAYPSDILPPMPTQASAQAHDVRYKPPPEAQGMPKHSDQGQSKETLSSQQSLNVAIMEAEVSVRSADDPLALVYKAAIESINEQLAPTLGPDALQHAVEQEIDTSAQATADRIVAGSTALLARYQAANPELSGQALIDQFLSVIKGGIEQGFGEAREILEGLQVLDEGIAADIDKTFALVEEGLATFREKQLEALGDKSEAVDSSTDAREAVEVTGSEDNKASPNYPQG